MTCAVATSAALFVRIVAAPSAICTIISASQNQANFVSAVAAAEFFPRQKRAAAATPRKISVGDEPVDHLQIHLKRGDGIFAVDFRRGARCNWRWLPALVSGQIFP